MIYYPSHLFKLVGCLILFSISCSFPSKSIDSSRPPQQTSADTIAHDAVVAALKKWTTVKSFRQRFTSTSDGAESSGSMEFVAPDRVRFVMNIAGEPFESITIGQTEYTKDVDGSWARTTLDNQAGTRQGHLFADPTQIAQLAANISDVQLVTTESGAESSKVYKFKHKLPNSTGVYETQMWVALSDGLPRRFETKYNFVVEGLARSGKASIVCSDYNSDIRIDPPK